MPVNANPYVSPEYLAVRIVARQREGDCCLTCRRRNHTAALNTRSIYGELEEGLSVIEVRCGAAHLDHDPWNNAPSNVAWLCRGDHLRHDLHIHLIHAEQTRVTNKDLARPLLAVGA